MESLTITYISFNVELSFTMCMCSQVFKTLVMQRLQKISTARQMTKGIYRYIKVKLKYLTWVIPVLILAQGGQTGIECLTGAMRFCEIFRKASRRWMFPYAPLWWRGRQDESE